MTGMLNVLAAGRSAHFSLTVATSGGVYGLDQGSFGSLSPSSLRGTLVDLLYANPGSSDLLIELPASLPQSFFSHVTVEDGTGAKRNYLASAATFSVIGGTRSQWRWGIGGASPVWNSGDETEVHTVVFSF
jgi:hypothetical protein